MSNDLIQVVKAEQYAPPSAALWNLGLADGTTIPHNIDDNGPVPMYIKFETGNIKWSIGDDGKTISYRLPRNDLNVLNTLAEKGVPVEVFTGTRFQEAPSDGYLDWDDANSWGPEGEYPDPDTEHPKVDEVVTTSPGKDVLESLSDEGMSTWRQDDIPLGELCDGDDSLEDIRDKVEAKSEEADGKLVRALPSHAIEKSVFSESRVQFEDNDTYILTDYEPGKMVLKVDSFADLIKLVTNLASYVGVTPRVTIITGLVGLHFRFGIASSKHRTTYVGNFQVTKIGFQLYGETQYLLTVE